MIVNVDGKAIEWICISYLAQDKVAHDEIWGNIDQHTANQERFGLPSRLIAKTFVFRLIYGGTAFSYANDPDFTGVSRSTTFWQGVIDEFYAKYTGIRDKHTNLIQEATSTGRIRMPTGRIYKFSSTQRGGNLEWPITKILNYPVQGLAADLMAIARVIFARKFRESGIPGFLISTIHDSIVVDIPDKYLEEICNLFYETFKEIPLKFKELFGVEFTLPTRCEVSFGSNKGDLTTHIPV